MAEDSISQNACVVYWLYDEKCVCPWRHGYVGISSKWERRLKTHKKSKRFPVGILSQILFRGSREKCLELEARFRPKDRIGWNINAGGAAGSTGPQSEEHREKIRLAALKRWSDEKKREEHRKIVKAAFVGIDRSGPNNSRFGIVMDEETKRNISAGRKGKAIGNQNWRKRGLYSEDALRKMGEASRLSWQTGDRKIPRGKDHPMFGRHHSDESKQKNRESQLLHDWSGERNSFYGKKHSDETRRILSVKARQRHQTKEN